MSLQKRKNMRLREYDYSQNGAYFVTICTESKRKILSEIRRGDPCGRPCETPELTELGSISETAFKKIEAMYNIIIDKYVIMPNHIHCILFIANEEIRATARVAPTTVGLVVGGYKSLIANEWLKICKNHNVNMGRIWQRNFYDHIIRNDEDYLRIWQYIETNPQKWLEDEYYTNENTSQGE